jgi:hypothetical protein
VLRRPPTRVVGSLTAAVLIAAVLTGCSPTVTLTAASYAADPGCAEVTVRLPDTLDEQERRQTDAQATAAWGEPATVLLHCGVEPLGPTTDRCISISGVDWVEDATDAPVYSYTTYGRSPAIEVTIDSEKASGTNVLTDLSGIVSILPVGDACVGAEDVELPDAEE